MLKAFEAIRHNVKLSPRALSIDNLVFKLHYRLTFLFLLGATVLVCSQQYIGEHIRCISDRGVPGHVLETFCFFTSTFTVPGPHRTEMPHPGIVPYDSDKDDVVHHAYYQWVPFVLFLQAIMFYAPHFLWKRFEGGRIQAMVDGFRYAALATDDKDTRVRDGVVPSKANRDKRIDVVRHSFLQRLHINRPWASAFVLCETLNVINLVLQFFILNAFLGGTFFTLGPRLLSPANGNETAGVLDLVFPKITKCTFHKYGASGTIQKHDAMCVMALNVVNEKIYTFLWFWMVILSVATGLGLLWRVLTIVLHSRSRAFNRMVFKLANPGTIEVWSLLDVTNRCHFSDWLFLYYLAKNIDGFVIRDLFLGLAKEMDAADQTSSADVTWDADDTKVPLAETDFIPRFAEHSKDK